MLRPRFMHIDRVHCTYCELCYATAPVIRRDTEKIPMTYETLEAMAACPTGAIVWCEDATNQRERKLS